MDDSRKRELFANARLLVHLNAVPEPLLAKARALLDLKEHLEQRDTERKEAIAKAKRIGRLVYEAMNKLMSYDEVGCMASASKGFSEAIEGVVSSIDRFNAVLDLMHEQLHDFEKALYPQSNDKDGTSNA